MNLSTAGRRHAGPGDRRQPVGELPRDLVTVAVAAAIAVAVVLLLVPPVDRRPVLTIDNPTPFALDLDVRGADGEAWMPLPDVPRQAEARAADVVDLGETWTFRVTGQGREAGTFTRTREELDRSGWSVTVPEEVVERLVAAGAPESTRS